MKSDSGYNYTLIFLLLLTTSTLHEANLDSIITSLIKSSCITTLYLDICYSTLSTVTEQLLTKKDVIELTITKTKEAIQANLHTINNHIAIPNLSTRAKLDLNDCLQMVDGTLQQLDIVIQELKAYPNKKSIRHHANDLKTLMSTTITNKETCLDSLLHKDASNGSGDYTTVVAAVEAAPSNSKSRSLSPISCLIVRNLIFGSAFMIAAMNSDSKDDNATADCFIDMSPPDCVTSMPRDLLNLHLIWGFLLMAESLFDSIWDFMYWIYKSKSVAGGSTTFNSATVAAVGEGFLARDITFQNAAGPSGEQAMALRVGSDLSAFYKCGIDGYKDTLFVHSNRQFYVDCLIVGTIDFIFGNAAVVFQDCDIQARRPNPKQMNTITAKGRTDPNQNTGIVVQKCKIKATSDLKPVQTTFPTYLGRPWKEYSRTVVMQSSISDVIVPARWYPWDGDFALDTLYYKEYKNKGTGVDASKRVTWVGWGVITNTTEAKSFMAKALSMEVIGCHLLASLSRLVCNG
nr:pectinesterase inhibitor domain, pectin lyase fold/virulence factor [Tanacetum cinerariifolium]